MYNLLMVRAVAVSEAAGGLSAEDRKKYAEQVTKQFWQAIGGNADEFEGLSSESDWL